MATNFFWIGYYVEEFRSQVVIRKKKLISRPANAFRKHLELLTHISHDTNVKSNGNGPLEVGENNRLQKDIAADWLRKESALSL